MDQPQGVDEQGLRGRANYELVRQEWAAHDTTDLDAALALLGAMEAGPVSARSGD